MNIDECKSIIVKSTWKFIATKNGTIEGQLLNKVPIFVAKQGITN